MGILLIVIVVINVFIIKVIGIIIVLTSSPGGLQMSSIFIWRYHGA